MLCIWLLCFNSASGGVPCSVQRDHQPPLSGSFWHDPLGLWGTQTRAGKESTGFCSDTCGTADQHTSWTVHSVRLPRPNFFVLPPLFNWYIFIFSLFESLWCEILLYWIFKRICKEFETIQEKAIKNPKTTEDMTEMIAYIGHAKTKGIEDLSCKIMVSS